MRRRSPASLGTGARREGEKIEHAEALIRVERKGDYNGGEGPQGRREAERQRW